MLTDEQVAKIASAMENRCQWWSFDIVEVLELMQCLLDDREELMEEVERLRMRSAEKKRAADAEQECDCEVCVNLRVLRKRMAVTNDGRWPWLRKYLQDTPNAPEPFIREFSSMVDYIERMERMLQRISEPEGAYNRDPLTHASNVIENVRAIALEALKEDQ